jgi:hypothetical protein
MAPTGGSNRLNAIAAIAIALSSRMGPRRLPNRPEFLP